MSITLKLSHREKVEDHIARRSEDILEDSIKNEGTFKCSRSLEIVKKYNILLKLSHRVKVEDRYFGNILKDSIENERTPKRVISLKLSHQEKVVGRHFKNIL